MSALLCCILLGLHFAGRSAQSPAQVPPSRQEASPASGVTAAQLPQLQAKAEAGAAQSQLELGRIYHEGKVVPKDDAKAVSWYRRAAEGGNAQAENLLGVMYRLGQGVTPDKAEAVGWYQKAAKDGSADGMFNLGVAYYNGDGVPSNEYTAYEWFLLAQDGGNSAAADAVHRSASSMLVAEKSDAFTHIAERYEKGDELPKNEQQALRWMRKAADVDSTGKIRLAVHLLGLPDAPTHYAEALDLCKAASKDDTTGLSCLGYMYRRGLGVPKDPAQAVKLYDKAAQSSNGAAMLSLAEMYSAGEGTKVNRPAAFVLLFRASSMGFKGAHEKARDLLGQMTKEELKETERKLRDKNLDPKKVIAAIQDAPPS